MGCCIAVDAYILMRVGTAFLAQWAPVVQTACAWHLQQGLNQGFKRCHMVGHPGHEFSYCPGQVPPGFPCLICYPLRALRLPLQAQ